MTSKSQSNNEFVSDSFYDSEEPWAKGGCTVTAFFRNLGILKDDEDNQNDKNIE